jgi:DNA-binding transcriptional ArsR family regulator
MSLEVGGGATTTGLRALAHPVRLRILSLLTGAAMTTAELARELELTHANTSYHVRQLLAAGVIDPVGEERIRGGVAKRYRYNMDREVPKAGTRDLAATYAALASELRRRATYARAGRGNLTDAELWVDPQDWDDVRHAVNAASRRLHEVARPARTPGTIRVNATMALFEMEPDA